MSLTKPKFTYQHTSKVEIEKIKFNQTINIDFKQPENSRCSLTIEYGELEKVLERVNKEFNTDHSIQDATIHFFDNKTYLVCEHEISKTQDEYIKELEEYTKALEKKLDEISNS